MKIIALALSIIIAGISLFAAKDADETKAKSENKIICEKEYKLVVPNDDKEIGTYSICAVQGKEPEKHINITETVSMNYRGKKVEYKSSVIYNSDSPISPESATVTTKVDGKVCMKGTVTFSEKTISFECTGFLNKRTGEPINPPVHFKKKNEPRPKGVLVFQSALRAIGPRLLLQEGELKDVVFIEFPDDIGAPELLLLRKGCRLVREKPDDKGEYSMKIYSPHFDKRISHIRYNKHDQTVSIASFWEVQFRRVDVERNK